MRNFINSFINVLVNIIITLLCLLLIFIVSIIIFSSSTGVEVEDTVSYVQSFITDDSDIKLTDKNSVNISYTDTTSNKNKNINKTKSLFYYEQLSDNSKIIYDALTNNIDNLKKGNYTIKFNTTFNKLLHQSNGKKTLNTAFQSALDAFLYDHPELFYIDISKMFLHIKYTSIGSKTTYTVSIIPEENSSYISSEFTVNNLNTAIQKVENTKNNLIASISENATDYEKALKVHNAIVNSLDYDISTIRPNTRNIYGALIEKKAVCEGYAKSFKYIMDCLDIECILVSGVATNSSGHTESHMWNYIKLNNKWYGIDATWDDPVVMGGSSKDIIRHNYFCKGSNVFNESHKIENKLSDNGMSFNYPTLSTSNYK